MKNKKFRGQLNPQAILIATAIMVLIVVIVIAFGAVFLANFSGQLVSIGATSGANTDAAQAAITTGQTALGSIPGWLPLVILAFILLTVLALIALIASVGGMLSGATQ